MRDRHGGFDVDRDQKGTKAHGPVGRERDIKTTGLLQRTAIGSDHFILQHQASTTSSDFGILSIVRYHRTKPKVYFSPAEPHHRTTTPLCLYSIHFPQSLPYSILQISGTFESRDEVKRLRRLAVILSSARSFLDTIRITWR
jgi:hypothetical protein